MKCFGSTFWLGLCFLLASPGAWAVDTIHLSSYPSRVRSDTTVNLLGVDFTFYLGEQHLIVNLAEGEIIYDPCPACDLSFDDTSTSVFLGEPENYPPLVQLNATKSTNYNVDWAPKPLSISGPSGENYKVARVALTNNAVGTWSYVGHEVSLVAFLPTPPTHVSTIVGGLMTQVPPSPGDFNGDGNVDGMDYLLWQNGQSPHPLTALDLKNWQTNYGKVDQNAHADAVPEPGAATLLGAFVVLSIARLQCR